MASETRQYHPHGLSNGSTAQLHTNRAQMALAMGRKEQERQKLNRTAINYHYENEEARFNHDMIHIHYDKLYGGICRGFCST